MPIKVYKVADIIDGEVVFSGTRRFRDDGHSKHESLENASHVPPNSSGICAANITPLFQVRRGSTAFGYASVALNLDTPAE